MILEDLTSGDTHRVYTAAWAIIRLRDADELDALAAALPEIRRSTEGLELGGIVVSNNAMLAFALRKLEYHRDRAGCLCRLYTQFLYYDPEKEGEAENVRVIDVVLIEDKWVDHYVCECTQCGAGFHVKEGEQHTTWWEWHRV